MSKTTRSSELLKCLCLGALACCLALAIAEGSLRLVGHTYRLYMGQVEFGGPDPRLIDAAFVYDKDLFWVDQDYYVRLNRASATHPNIILTGDSCTAWGHYDYYFAQLAKLEMPEVKISYEKLGVVGWSSFQGLRQFERDIVPLKPKVVAAYFGWNDHWLSYGLEDKQVALINKTSDDALNRFRVFQAYRAVADRIRHLLWRHRYPKRVSPEDFRRNLTQMAMIAKKEHIALILMTAPTSHERGREPQYLLKRWLNELGELVGLHRQYAEIVREVSREQSVPLCDLLQKFDELSPKERAVCFKGDGIHLTEEGDKRIARFLMDCFKENKVLMNG